MYHQLLRRFVKWTQGVLACLVAAWLVYRGNTHSDLFGAGLMVPAMCVLSAFFLMASTFALILRSPERSDAA